MKLDSSNKPYEVLAGAVQSQSDFIKEYFGSFKVTELPTSTVVRDSDEWEQEQSRLNPRIKESIANGIRAGAFPEILEMLK